mmetsp:Transcript_30772/g.59379  ORF Transcript_30772/g.59379 Transcript_30772/m.59379 type:complete len:234 (-) Transcript_30772:468-1169(-)
MPRPDSQPASSGGVVRHDGAHLRGDRPAGDGIQVRPRDWSSQRPLCGVPDEDLLSHSVPHQPAAGRHPGRGPHGAVPPLRALGAHGPGDGEGRAEPGRVPHHQRRDEPGGQARAALLHPARGDVSPLAGRGAGRRHGDRHHRGGVRAPARAQPRAALPRAGHPLHQEPHRAQPARRHAAVHDAALPRADGVAGRPAARSAQHAAVLRGAHGPRHGRRQPWGGNRGDHHPQLRA